MFQVWHDYLSLAGWLGILNISNSRTVIPSNRLELRYGAHTIPGTVRYTVSELSPIRIPSILGDLFRTGSNASYDRDTNTLGCFSLFRALDADVNSICFPRPQ